MIHFPDKILHRYTYTDTGTDVYGASINEYVYAGDVLVDFQNEQNKEIREAFGVARDNLYKIYFDKDTIINDSDELRDDTGNKYEIIGEIRKYTHFHNYKEANLIRKRGGGNKL